MSIDGNTVLEINKYFPADKPPRCCVFPSGQPVGRATSKFEMQHKYYHKIIGEQPNWIHSGMYADEGVENYTQFNTMIREAKAGKIDLIVTKSVSHLNRNILDCIAVARDLLKFKKPVGIYFENEAFCTLRSQSDTMLCFYR